MQRIADDFTSIRQEMERIEAERGGAGSGPEPVEATYSIYGVYTPLKIPVGALRAIGTVKLQNGQYVTYTDWADYITPAGVPIVEVADDGFNDLGCC